MSELSEAEIMAQASKVIPEKKQDELEILFEGPKTFQVGDETITIRPFKFGELPKVIALLRSVGGTFAHHKSQNTLNTVEGMMDIIAVGGENLIASLAMNTGKPREYFDTLDMDVGTQIMIDFVGINIGFFTKRVLPMLQKME
jgi:hypothetical protein